MYDVGGESKYKLQLCGEFHEKTYFFNGKKFSDGRLSNVSGEGGGGKNIIMPRRCFNRGGGEVFSRCQRILPKKIRRGRIFTVTYSSRGRHFTSEFSPGGGDLYRRRFYTGTPAELRSSRSFPVLSDT